MLLVCGPGGALERAKRRAVSSGCGSSVAKLVTLEVSLTLCLQGRKPYTSLVISPTSQSHTSLKSRSSCPNVRIFKLRPPRALCKAPLGQRKVAAARAAEGCLPSCLPSAKAPQKAG